MSIKQLVRYVCFFLFVTAALLSDRTVAQGDAPAVAQPGPSEEALAAACHTTRALIDSAIDENSADVLAVMVHAYWYFRAGIVKASLVQSLVVDDTFLRNVATVNATAVELIHSSGRTPRTIPVVIYHGFNHRPADGQLAVDPQWATQLQRHVASSESVLGHK